MRLQLHRRNTVRHQKDLCLAVSVAGLSFFACELNSSSYDFVSSCLLAGYGDWNGDIQGKVSPVVTLKCTLYSR